MVGIMSGPNNAGGAEGSGAQITIKLTTKLAQEYAVPLEPLAVPANLTRFGLSKIVNSLLQLDPPRPFDFLVNNELLRLSLHNHLLQRQITTEAVLDIEYIPAVLPPELKEQHSHDDWVSAVTGLSFGGTTKKHEDIACIVTGCYNGTVNLWKDGAIVSTFLAHTGPVKTATTTQINNTKAMLLTTGDDCVARAWCWDTTSTDAMDTAPQHIAVLQGHTASIEALAVAPSGRRCATGGWDNKICLWRAGQSLLDVASVGDNNNNNDTTKTKEASKKRRKVAGGNDSSSVDVDAVPVATHEEQPLMDLPGHTQCISDLSWPTEDTLVSCSWDHAITVWDLDVYAPRHRLTHNKAVHCVAAAPHSGHTVVFGGPEKSIRIWDTRIVGAVSTGLPSMASHTDWVSCLAWHPSSEHHVVSGSYDMSAKLWDIRAASVPLHTMTGHTEKVLGVSWVGEREVVTGGADNSMRQYTVKL